MIRIQPSRRAFLGAALGAAPVLATGPGNPVVDTHVHLFASDTTSFPYAPNAPYQPKAITVETYLAFAHEAKIDHAVIVHPEPYQDDHRYLEYCFAHEQPKGFFKGTCLFDPIAPDTPRRMEELTRRNPGKIVSLRIHEMGERGSGAETGGAIKNRDLSQPSVRRTLEKCQELGLAVQFHFLPYHARSIGQLAASFPAIPMILDHLGRAGMGTPQDYNEVLTLGKLPRAYMKISGLTYSSKQKAPFADAKPLVMRAYDAFGPDRLIWGGLGHTTAEYREATAVFETMFGGIPQSEQEKIRGRNAVRLFRF